MACCYFFTGLPCSGKTTIARELNNRIDAVWFDGDQVRKTPIVEDPNDFSFLGRQKHIKRLGYIAKLFVDRNINVIISCIAPDRLTREEVRSYFKIGQFVEIYINTPFEICEKRDVKGLYKAAREGIIDEFTGITSRYMAPENPEITIDYDQENKLPIEYNIETAITKILNLSYYKDARNTSFIIGRFQPFHLGHKQIIDSELKKNNNVIIGIKFYCTDMKNPFTPSLIKEMIEAVYGDNKNVKISFLENFNFICHGRNVGYGFKNIQLDQNIENISATNIREMILDGNDGWKLLVPEEVIPIIEKELDL